MFDNKDDFDEAFGGMDNEEQAKFNELMVRMITMSIISEKKRINFFPLIAKFMMSAREEEKKDPRVEEELKNKNEQGTLDFDDMPESMILEIGLSMMEMLVQHLRAKDDRVGLGLLHLTKLFSIPGLDDITADIELLDNMSMDVMGDSLASELESAINKNKLDDLMNGELGDKND